MKYMIWRRKMQDNTEAENMTGGIVLESRIRLIRNLQNTPFPDMMSTTDMEKVINLIKASILDNNSEISENYHFILLPDIDELQAISLAEHNLVSPEFISETSGRALILRNDNSVSIMINESDHIKIESIEKGMNLTGAYRKADLLDSVMGKNLDYAFSDQFGYLTQSLTDLGTGLRPSLIMHIPCIDKTGSITQIRSNLNKLGISVKPEYVFNGKALGSIYKFTNLITLGLNENTSIQNLVNICKQICEEEIEDRKKVTASSEFQDGLSRSVAILKSAKILRLDEFLDMISYIRCGLICNFLHGIDINEIDNLRYEVQPATLAYKYKINESQLDQTRADIVRDKINSLV
jgi:protein arginine kinase